MMKTCPYCAEKIKEEARVCKHCGKSLTTEEAKALFEEEEEKKKAEEEEKLKKEEEEKERKHFESLSEKEKQKYLLEKDKENIFNALLITIGIISFVLLFKFPYALPLPILLAILLYSKQGEVFIENMIKNYKKNRTKISLALAGLGLLVVIAISAPYIVENIKTQIKRSQAEEEAKVAEKFPEPSVEIISSAEHQGDSLTYTLEFRVKDTDTVRVYDVTNSHLEDYDNKEEVYTYTSELSEIESKYEIHLFNEYKSSITELVITRDETEEEKEIRLAYEAEERKKQEEAEAEQLEWERSEAGKLCEEYSYWSESDCTKVADNKYWIGMSYEMLIELRGKPNSANPSDYGYGTSWQWCWTYYTPMCFYDDDDDGIIDMYN